MCRSPGEKLGVNNENTRVEKREIMLESINCEKIDVELLTCYCETRKPPQEVYLHITSVCSFLSGLNGEIYQMYLPPPFSPTIKCDNREIYTIFKAIVRGRNPRLSGIEKIFEEVSMPGFNVVSNAGRRDREIFKI